MSSPAPIHREGYLSSFQDLQKILFPLLCLQEEKSGCEEYLHFFCVLAYSCSSSQPSRTQSTCSLSIRSWTGSSDRKYATAQQDILTSIRVLWSNEATVLIPFILINLLASLNFTLYQSRSTPCSSNLPSFYRQWLQAWTQANPIELRLNGHTNPMKVPQFKQFQLRTFWMKRFQSRSASLACWYTSRTNSCKRGRAAKKSTNPALLILASSFVHLSSPGSPLVLPKDAISTRCQTLNLRQLAAIASKVSSPTHPI